MRRGVLTAILYRGQYLLAPILGCSAIRRGGVGFTQLGLGPIVPLLLLFVCEFAKLLDRVVILLVRDLTHTHERTRDARKWLRPASAPTARNDATRPQQRGNRSEPSKSVVSCTKPSAPAG